MFAGTLLHRLHPDVQGRREFVFISFYTVLIGWLLDDYLCDSSVSNTWQTQAEAKDLQHPDVFSHCHFIIINITISNDHCM